MSFKVENILTASELEEFNRMPPAAKERFLAQFDEEVSNVLKPFATVIGAAEKILDLVHDSDILEGVAKLQWKYYLQLVKQGFTSEQALALASSFASLLQATKKSS